MPIIDTLPPQQQIEFIIMQNARAVNDIATFDFKDYYVDDTSNWAVVNIIPDNNSGSGTIPDAHIDATTGTMVNSTKAAIVVMKKGKWKLLSASVPSHPAYGTFSWTEPIEHFKRVFDAEDFYSPFSYGGVIIFKPNPGGQGIDLFQHPRLIFYEWKDMVQPAFTYSAQVHNILDGKAIKSDETVLKNTLYQPNPLLSSLALRELCRLQLIKPESCANLLRGKDTNLVSVFVNLMITASAPDKRNEWIKELTIVVKNASSSKYLQSLGLGAFSAVIFNSQNREASAGGITILNDIQQQLETLRIDNSQAPELYYMLDKSGIH